MKHLLAILSLCALSVSAASLSTMKFAFTPGDNPGGTEHLIFWGTSPGGYTNLANPMRIPYAQTNFTLSNLVAGVRYYVVVQETDGEDVSVYSNEVVGKTKLNQGRNLTITAIP